MLVLPPPLAEAVAALLNSVTTAAALPHRGGTTTRADATGGTVVVGVAAATRHFLAGAPASLTDSAHPLALTAGMPVAFAGTGPFETVPDATTAGAAEGAAVRAWQVGNALLSRLTCCATGSASEKAILAFRLVLLLEWFAGQGNFCGTDMKSPLVACFLAGASVPGLAVCCECCIGTRSWFLAGASVPRLLVCCECCIGTC